jgi:hypothetical protein
MQAYSYDNPVNALLDFKPNFYDLLLSDVNMPLMDVLKDINVKVFSFFCYSLKNFASHPSQTPFARTFLFSLWLSNYQYLSLIPV